MQIAKVSIANETLYFDKAFDLSTNYALVTSSLLMNAYFADQHLRRMAKRSIINEPNPPPPLFFFEQAFDLFDEIHLCSVTPWRTSKIRR